MQFFPGIFSGISGDFTQFLLSLPVILLALTFHEAAHGFAAYKLGDPTARNFGRLTLNPLKHLDLIGTLMMVLFHFGWAKPVPVNARYFKKPRRDMALTAAAGPAANLLLGFAGLLLYSVYITVMVKTGLAEKAMSSPFAATLINRAAQMLSMLFSLNISLGIFNLIPIPPLDGSRLFYIFLPPKLYWGIMRYERYIQIALMAALWFGLFNGVLNFLVGGVMDGMIWIVSKIPFLLI